MSKKAKRTETAPQKANSSLIALCAVLVVAVVLIVVLFVRSNNLNSQLDTLNTELTETNATLQQTVTDKEAVQEQLTAAEESLREAQLTLEESTKKVADLEGQLTALTDETIQMFVDGRGPSLKDVWIDFAGVTVGMAILYFGHDYVKKRKHTTKTEEQT
jgi:septal ring factor EnvC (AmiA/AmiB activator)